MAKLISYILLGVLALVLLVTGTWIFPFQERGTGSRWLNWAFGFDFTQATQGGPLRAFLPSVCSFS